MLGTDLTPFFNPCHFAVPIIMGSQSGYGILDTPGQVLHNGDIASTDYVLTCEAAKFGAALYGAPLTVNGISYTVRYVEPYEDGVLCQIMLSKI